MIAREALRAGLMTALRPVLIPLGVTLFDAVPVRASVPQAVLGEPSDSDWGAAGIEGRELRVALTLTDEGEQPQRLRACVQAAEAVSLAGVLADGWRVAGLSVTATRMAKAGARWTASVEWRARLWRVGQ
ncbi:tail completion protein gp17 [Sphingomonas parapaucimobilis]|uniref:tail completion protein gp17 n=1 Tax=Sphingomonas parapaucimobilis TaxID=28213 RepID=UPI00321ADA11